MKLTIGVIILFTLAFFIFFSKSVYSFNIPTVTGTLPINGTLSKTEETKGTIDWLNVAEIYSEIGGKIEEIYINEGDMVEEGQSLVRFSFSEDDIHMKLKEIEISRSRLQIDIENLNIRLNKIDRYILDLEADVYEAEEVSRYELDQLKEKISTKLDEYETTEILYEAGGTTKQSLDNLELEIKGLNDQYDNLKKTLANQEQKESEAIADKEKNRQKQLLDYQHEITTINQDLKAKNLDFKNLELQEANYKKTLSDYGTNTVIYSDTSGIVTEINIKKGQYANANTYLISLGLSNDYKIVCEVSQDNDFIALGDECTLYNSSYDNYFYGVVTKILSKDNHKEITISISSDEITAGETFDISFEKETAQRSILIPNGALNQDSDGYFVYQIKRRDGILGKEYYPEKIRVYIGDSDNDYTMITKGITFFEPLVLLSDKPFSENDTIKIKNEGDFFASE